jgi:hypothetical protein
MSCLRRAGRGLGQLWLALSIAIGGLTGPAAASHELLHDDEPHAAHAQHAQGHHDLTGDSGAATQGEEEGCQPDPLCVAGCAHAASALPPLRLPAAALLRSPAATAPADDAFRSRSPERQLRPPILPLHT